MTTSGESKDQSEKGTININVMINLKKTLNYAQVYSMNELLEPLLASKSATSFIQFYVTPLFGVTESNVWKSYRIFSHLSFSCMEASISRAVTSITLCSMHYVIQLFGITESNVGKSYEICSHCFYLHTVNHSSKYYTAFYYITGYTCGIEN